MSGKYFVENSGWIDKDFTRYVLETKDLNFNTEDYFVGQDDYIQDHIDTRLEMSLKGSVLKKHNKEALDFIKQEKNFRCKIKKEKGLWSIDFENIKYVLSRRHFEFCVWWKDSGLKTLPANILNKLAGTTLIDAGAFIGDTSLVFLKYNPQKILAFEPEPDIYKDLLITIKANDADDKIFAINKGLGEKEKEGFIENNSSASSMLSVAQEDFKVKSKVKITTIDEVSLNEKIGLIKMDIEGFEFYAISGALETIKRDKPVLAICIYHTGKDFFEIPPMIKQVVPEYKMKILDSCPRGISEKLLICWVD